MTNEHEGTGAFVAEGSDAVRRSQRLASQLHQLVATTIATSGAPSETNVLLAVAGRARSLLDCDEAMVRLRTPLGTISAVAALGGPVRLLDEAESHEGPGLDEVSEDPRELRGWLTVPILASWNDPQGLIAVRRSAEQTGDDDAEIISLLAQMTASAVAEARLRDGVRAREARWRALVGAAPVGIVEVSRDGRAHWWNDAAAALLNWAIVDGDDAAPPVDWDPTLFDQLLPLWEESGATSSRGEARLESAGRHRELRVSVSPLGAGDRLLTLLDDVTDESEMVAELRQARGGEIKAELAASVAHDFNNLLTLITGYTEVLDQSLQDQEARSLVHEIQTTTRRAAQITQQLQNLGRTQTRESSVLDVRALLESNAEVIERMVGPAIVVEHDFSDDAGNVQVDADQFEQMILNLIINARDAMTDGGTVRLSVRNVPENRVVLEVADTGTGMDAETLAHCFDPFFTTKGPLKGTGVGLAAARRLVEASGGRIDAMSEVGVGTTFTIDLPRTTRPADANVLDEATAHPSRAGATLLVVEDDGALRRLMVQVLRRAGYRVLEADDGAAALEVAADGEVDALVSDVDMPVLGGVELALTLQATSPRLPVLLVSGHANEAVLRELTPRSGAFLAKPFRPSALVDRVNALLART